jgi:LmbE family N-acetylglucosaminyl deacetylase
VRLFLAIALAALPLQARQRTASFPSHERVLWIAAHPDDEAMIAPVLGRKCVEERATCTLLVMTRGEGGECKLPGGCADVGTVRAAEMASASVLFRAQLIQWSLPDVFTPQVSWPQSLRNDIAAVIATVKPDVIYTFDPNHGSSCHEAHRYTALRVLEAANGIPVQLIETAIHRENGISFSAATSRATEIDARRWWRWLIEDLRAHPSQFSPAEVDEIERLPETQQRVWLMEKGLLAGAAYDFLCPNAQTRSYDR